MFVVNDMPKPIEWHALLVDGYEPLRKAQKVFRRLPRDPRCALCRLGHRELLDAAHIREDTRGGKPVVPNGLSMCAIHHRAFDSFVLAVSPAVTSMLGYDPDDVAGHPVTMFLEERDALGVAGPGLITPAAQKRDLHTPSVSLIRPHAPQARGLSLSATSHQVRRGASTCRRCLLGGTMRHPSLSWGLDVQVHDHQA